jgi:uncharacterized protein YgfB (UPF0149 family)
MGNEYEDEDNESLPTGKGLRAQLEAALAKLEATEAKLKEKEKVEREISVGSFLQARGLNPKVKDLIPESVVETDALEEWVNTYADVFGLAANNTEGKSNINPEDVNAANRMRNLANSGSRPSSFDDLAERIKREDVDPLQLLKENKDLFLNQ